MNAKIRRKLAGSKRRIEKRLDKRNTCGGDQPVFSASNIHYEVADRTRGISSGGIGMMHLVARRLNLAQAIDARLHLLKFHFPYHESDHVLNIAYNVLAGGTRLEHLELLRTNEVYLDALGAQRIPDPTTAGDFCRRFTAWDVLLLMETFNAIRVQLWRQQDEAFLAEAILDADGTMVETGGQCKQGIDINYQGQWGYHPLLISLAATGEPLYIVNRSGNRPSHEHAELYLDRAIAYCREAGFRQITLRGDTDFTQTEHLDRWDEAGVKFVFGIDAMPKLYEMAENLPPTAWRRLERPPRYEVQTQPRSKPPRVKEAIVRRREFDNLRLSGEYVAEFDYRPAKCRKTYRLVVVWKELEVSKGERKLFDDSRCFFYITNERDAPASQVVFKANGRCHQENHIEQLKNGVPALAAPLESLVSNWAYMVMAALAWSLKAWAALLLPDEKRERSPSAKKKPRQTTQKQTLLRMEFATFRQALLNIPAQIVRTGRRIIYRWLSWNPWQETFFRLLDQLALPRRC